MLTNYCLVLIGLASSVNCIGVFLSTYTDYNYANCIVASLPSLAIWLLLHKGECNLNQSKDDSFVERVAKNNNWNNGDRLKIQEIFLINCFVFVITLVWKTIHSLAMAQI